MLRRALPVALLTLSLAAVAFPADPDRLSLTDALKMARANNGQIRASLVELRSSRSQATSAFGAFLPSVTPGFSYETGRTKFLTGQAGGQVTRNQDSTSFVDVRVPLLDNGTRYLRLASARENLEAQRADTVNTLRQTLFLVHQRFYNALRAEELLKVQESQLARTRSILEETTTRAEIGDEAKIRILQAKADALNAEVSVLEASNSVATNLANLRAIIGIEPTAALPPLGPGESLREPMGLAAMPQVIADGLARRPDLISRRRQVDAARSQARLARMDGLVSFSLDATYRKQFANNPLDRSLLQLNASIPLFDGFQTRENTRIREFVVQSQSALLLQAERDARAEIESAYVEYLQNTKRQRAAQAAFEAADENFRAAQDGRRLGAGTLLDILTAQLSLVTAEVNRTQATYDLLISEIRLKVVTGTPIPGEES